MVTQPMEVPLVAKPFYRATKEQIISSDTLRNSAYGKYIEPVHGLGGFFASLKTLGFLEYIGETRSTIPSNKGRKIDCFRWTEKAKETFGE